MKLLENLLFCELYSYNRKSEKGNTSSLDTIPFLLPFLILERNSSLASRATTTTCDVFISLFFTTDFVDILLFLLWLRANWKSTERYVKEREREKIEFHLNFIHFAPTR